MADKHPWGKRGSDERDTDSAHYLERVLEVIPGCKDIARRAGKYHFDDYRCPDEVSDGLEKQRLVNELEFKLRPPWQEEHGKAMLVEVIDAIKSGEFDNTREESAEWAKTPEGKATFAMIFGSQHDKPSPPAT